MASVLGSINVEWPSSVQTIFDGPIALLDFDVDIISFGCLTNWTYAHNFALQLSLPLLVGFGCMISYLVAYSVYTTHFYLKLPTQLQAHLPSSQARNY